MMEARENDLRIDPGFLRLIQPLTVRGMSRLENTIRQENKADPIVVWNGVILNGHERYIICRTYRIPYSVTELSFNCREEAVIWICRDQLKRTHLSDEMRKYLIGIEYEASKLLNIIYSSGQKAAGTQNSDGKEPKVEASRHATAKRIGTEHHMSWGTVRKYSIYAKAIDSIRKKDPAACETILSGRCKISHDLTVELAAASPDRIKEIMDSLDLDRRQYAQYKNARLEIGQGLENGAAAAKQAPASVKDMPPFDPDAELNALALTIPSWVANMDRIIKNADMTIVTEQAGSRLARALESLASKAVELIRKIQEA